MSVSFVHIKGARQHNLKNIDLAIPRSQLVVITGVSGSGKSSLAMDTLFAEGQRRYVESLSAYARQFIGQLDKPDVDAIEGLSPAIAIDQRSLGRSPRSTVGTATEIYDFLRVLYVRIGRPHCPVCGKEISATPVDRMKEILMAAEPESRLWLYAPLVKEEKGAHQRLFNRLAQEGFLRVRVDGELRELTEDIALPRGLPHTVEVLVDRLEVHPDIASRLMDSLETAARLSGGVVKVELQSGAPRWFCERPYCAACDRQVPELNTKLFSFNDPYGACPSCNGLGYLRMFDPELIVPEPRRSLRQGAIAPWVHCISGRELEEIEALSVRYGGDLDTAFDALPEDLRRILLFGTGTYGTTGRSEKTRGASRETVDFQGVIPWLEHAWEAARDSAAREALKSFMSTQTCPVCGGARLRPEALHVKVAGRSIHALSILPIGELRDLLVTLPLTGEDAEIARGLLEAMERRLVLLESLGLQYLSLDRSSETLSGGEAQRIRLAGQMGAALVGILYILDEPSVGLHPQDQSTLLQTLRRLQEAGNTVIVVEHEAQTIRAADYVVDMGPGAGEHGGRVIYAGPPEGILACRESLTGAYLSNRRRIPVPNRRRSTEGPFIEVSGARAHNLQDLKVAFPLGCLICVTGVSGSGKSTLVVDILFQAAGKGRYRKLVQSGWVRRIRGLEAVDKVIDIDQSSIGRTPRSNPATYTGVFQHIRNLFAQLPESRLRGYRAGRYSFNIKGGRCESCQGEGVRRVEMYLLPDVYVTCDACRGSRYNSETLEIRFKGMNIADVLDLTVNEASRSFENVPKVMRILQTLQAVGLGYLRLGQPAPTLSGGEAQRIKLARELSKQQTGRTLYILDEPTTGLHFEDIRYLLEVLQRLVDAGNTVVIIEHNLEVIKCADYVVDLGPGAGENGGHLVAAGSPEQVAACESSATAPFLRTVLPGPREAPETATP
jgi:excinuclease ABC subunit A